MNIDIECTGLLSLILQDSPQGRQFILCVLARSNSDPTRITFNPNTDYPTFYGYSNSRIPFYLMEKEVLSNVPREGYTKRLISSNYLSYAETIINRAEKLDIHQKLISISKFITLDNRTVYKDAEVFLVFRDKASDYIKAYVASNKKEASSLIPSKNGNYSQSTIETAQEIIKNDPDYLERNRRLEQKKIKKTAKMATKLFKKPTTQKVHFSPNLYDEKIPTLKLFNEDIPVPPGTNQDYMCQVIFLKFTDGLDQLDELEMAKSGQKVWSWDEVIELSGSRIAPRSDTPNNEGWRTVYNAAHAVNDLVAKKTTIDDFFLTKPTKTVRINPKYLL